MTERHAWNPGTRDPTDPDRFNLSQQKSNTLEEFRTALDELEAVLKMHGFPIGQTSRIGAYRNLLKKIESIRNISPSEFSDLVTARTDASRLAQSILTLSAPPDTRGWHSKVRLALRGPHSPQPVTTAPSIRDIEFELYFAAISKMAGYEVGFDEPDVVLGRSGISFGAAVKCPRGMQGVLRAADSAGKQIHKSGKPGLLALDISNLMDPSIPIFEDAPAHLAYLEEGVQTFSNRVTPGIRAQCTRMTFGVMYHLRSTAVCLKERAVVPSVRIVATNFCGKDDSHYSVLMELLREIGRHSKI